jgi:hypothetical protein
LPFIFVGFDRARRLLRAISTDTLIKWTVRLAGDETFLIQVEGLFDGTLPTNVDERVALRNRGADAITDHVLRSPFGARRFELYLGPGVEAIMGSTHDAATQRDRLCELLREPSFSFNQVIISQMREEMRTKCSLIGPEKSFLYVIFARMRNPIPTVQHAYLIEQFVAEGAPRFRLHGSWIHEGNFVDNMARQREMGGEIWDVKALQVFLKNLEHAYCKQIDGSTLYRCFGYGLNERERPLVQFESNCLHGIALAYVVMSFNPTDAVHHLAELVNYGLSL